jgi:hypothetical protein
LAKDGIASPSMPPRQRSPYDVIEAAISENRTSEYILFGFAIFFVLTGAAVLGYSLWTGQWQLSVGAAIETGLFYPAMREVHRIRNENQKIRLLEIPLMNAKTADEAAAVVHKVFQGGFQDGAAIADTKT